MAYILPSYGGQYDSIESAQQNSPLLNKYSPRLFGSPPQLSNLCDMRIRSSDGTNPGAVGDFYLNDVLRNAQIANFVVGRALFTGGYNSIMNALRMIAQYAYALSKYNVFDDTGGTASINDPNSDVLKEMDLETFKNMTNTAELESSSISDVLTGANVNGALPTDGSVATDEQMAQAEALEQANSEIDSYIDALAAAVGGGIVGMIKESFTVEQPFYTFDDDWYTYINNVKMMINSAIIMLGLQDACVRIGDIYYPIGMDHDDTNVTDVWSNYRFITPDADTGVPVVTSINNQKGNTNQYVTFMISPVSESEVYQNDVTESSIYSSVINQGSEIGKEIAFITNTSVSSISDAVVNIASGAVSVAESVVSALGGGVGRFTAAIVGSMARTFVGDHTIYPQIFQRHSSHQGVTMNIKLRASRGDPYSYLTEILVPLFFLLGMALPKMSQHSAAAYCYPPLVQCSIPGIWGTRLGMIQSLDIQKNPDGNDTSINGYPLSVNISVRVVDLQHVMVTSPMNEPALFLNNHTMFDYIAQCCGVDKYRVNGSIRMVTKIALAASFNRNIFYNVGNAILNDVTTYVNKFTRTSQI